MTFLILSTFGHIVENSQTIKQQFDLRMYVQIFVEGLLKLKFLGFFDFFKKLFLYFENLISLGAMSRYEWISHFETLSERTPLELVLLQGTMGSELTITGVNYSCVVTGGTRPEVEWEFLV